MKTWKKLALCAACFAAISFAMPDYADAARLGRGRSFGSSSIMKNPAPAPSGIKSGASSATTMNRQAAGQQNASGGAAAMTQNRGGLFGGLFGGLLAGTLLGSMLGGTGLGGAIGSFMNILLFVALGFFAMRLFRRLRGGQEERRQDWQERSYEQRQPFGQSQSQGSAWDALRSEPQAVQQDAAESAVPADFDQDEFLRGAKAAYTRLQASWDRRDLNDIANFATEDVMAELREQAASDPNPSKTEILLVNASLLEVRDEGDKRRVAVYFDVLMREDQRAAHPEQVREVWHFVCSTAAGDSWKLDGIQQLA
ncbi:MAG: Tim44 domain-containing protein [Mailhella sp.]|nr:Tim44 domain-containing protein [Mailhella sp.]